MDDTTMSEDTLCLKVDVSRRSAHRMKPVDGWSCNQTVRT